MTDKEPILTPENATCSVSLHTHTKNLGGHTWMSLTDEKGQQSFYGVTPTKRFPDAPKRPHSRLEHSLETIRVLAHDVLGDTSLKFGPIRKRSDHDYTLTIPIKPQQHDTIIIAAEAASKQDKKYQILGIGNNRENCITILEKILLEADVNLNHHLPASTWVETVKAPHSLILRGKKLHEKAEPNLVGTNSEQKPALFWVAEILNAAEAGIRNIVRK